MTDTLTSNESAIVDQLMHAPFTTAAMRRQAAETIARLMVERDDAKADYARVHRDYMNYRYGGSPPGTPPGRLADETPAHETCDELEKAARDRFNEVHQINPRDLWELQPEATKDTYREWVKNTQKALLVGGDKS